MDISLDIKVWVFLVPLILQEIPVRILMTGFATINFESYGKKNVLSFFQTVPSLEKAFEKYVLPEKLDCDNAYMCNR